MKATIHGIEIEGTVEEIAKLIFEIDSNKKSPPASTFPTYPTYVHYPPTYVTPLPSVVNPNPIMYPQVWCDGFSDSGSVTCKQDDKIQMYNSSSVDTVQGFFDGLEKLVLKNNTR